MKLFGIALLLLATSAAGVTSRGAEPSAFATHLPPCIELRDQFDAAQKLSFPTTNVTVLTVADKKGSAQVDGWIAALRPRYAGRIDIRGLADVGGVPEFVQGRIRKVFRDTRKHPVMLDWSGKIRAQLGCQKGVANILVLDREGVIHARFTGAATPAALDAADAALARVLSLPAGTDPGNTSR